MLKIFFIFLVLILSGCSNLQNNIKWEESKIVMSKYKKLNVGDIIIKKKLLFPYSWFGHAAIVVSNNTIGEYPKFNVGYCETGILDWLYDDRQIIILRYKYFDEKFKEEFLNNIKNYKGKIYKLGFDKYDEDYFYCSKYIWLLYIKTAEKLNYKLDFSKYERQLYIYAYRFLSSDESQILRPF